MRILMLGIAAAFFLLGEVAAQRVFTDTKGRTLSGSIVAARADKVTLKLKSGKTTTFAVKLLDEDGRKFVEQWKKSNPDIKLDIRFEKNMASRHKSGRRTTEMWNYDIVVRNNGFESVDGLVIRYELYKSLHDRYARGKSKKSTSSAGTGTIPLGVVRNGKTKTLPTKQVKISEVNSISETTTTITYERWNEALAGISVEVLLDGVVVATKKSGLGLR